MITDVHQFFVDGCGRCDRFATDDCSARRWRTPLAALRALCREAGLDEVVKWGHPTYMHAGRNLVILGATRGDVRLSFVDAALLADPDRVLERQGPNTRHPDALRFTDAADVDRLADVIRRYLAEAKGHAEAGRRPPRDTHEAELPDELTDALAADPELAAAFAALTPWRRRSYAIALSSAKTSATRVARIEKFRPKILAGKGAMDR